MNYHKVTRSLAGFYANFPHPNFLIVFIAISKNLNIFAVRFTKVIVQDQLEHVFNKQKEARTIQKIRKIC